MSVQNGSGRVAGPLALVTALVLSTVGPPAPARAGQVTPSAGLAVPNWCTAVMQICTCVDGCPGS